MSHDDFTPTLPPARRAVRLSVQLPGGDLDITIEEPRAEEFAALLQLARERLAR